MPDGDIVKPSATKVPMPRQLGDDENLESLQHWKVTFRNYFRRDDYFNVFLPAAFTWNPAEANYGLAAETTGLKRSAEVLKNDLVAFLETIAGFLPYSYVTERILNNTTSLKDVWAIIADLYEAEVSSDTFLELSTFSKLPNESFRQFYERMVDHVQKHLTKPNVKLENYDSGNNGDKMNISMLNLIVMMWLQKIDPKLVDVVRVEYSAELKDGKQLYEIMPRIAKSVSQLLLRHDTFSTKLVQSENPATHSEAASIQKVQFRNKKSNKNKKYATSQSRSTQQHCPHCQFLSKLVKYDIPADHDPDSCVRKPLAIRQVVESDPSSSTEASDNGKHFYHSPKINLLTPSTLQNDRDAVRERLGVQFLPCDVLTENITPSPCSNTEIISDLDSKFYSTLRAVTSVDKVKSPSFLGKIDEHQVVAIVDEGAELNVLDNTLAKKLNLEVEMSRKLAKAAGGSKLLVIGQSVKPLTLYALTDHGPVPVDLGNVVVVQNLGCDVLVGEPAKGANNIITIPASKTILFYLDGKYIPQSYLSANTKGQLYEVARVSKTTTLYKGDTLHLTLPDKFKHATHVSVNPRGVDAHWFDPAVYSVNGGQVLLRNSSTLPVVLKRGQHIGEVRLATIDNSPTHISDTSLFQLVDDIPEARQYHHEGHVQVDGEDHLHLVQLDPDNQLTEADRLRFSLLLKEFKSIITPIPGRYNGAFGMVDNAILFAEKPAPVTKVYQPKYTDEMKLLMAKKMDDLFSWGCLAYPETLGIQTMFVSPSMLLPKQEKNEFRLVTDFGALNRYIRKKPTSQPTIKDAKKALASAKFHCHLDLSNYYHQSGMKREDCAYLGVQHPFKGVMVYTVEPQGLRNAGENSFEKLGRMLGDMMQEGKAARMADAVHALGNTVDELYDNLKEILSRAKQAGLTFKPSKLIIAPKRTTLFGWTLDGTEWLPSTHATSTLSKATLPTTVKMLRSFLGSFKQFVDCVPNCAHLLHTLELMVANKKSADKLDWSDDAIKVFEAAKLATNSIKGVHVPIPSDQLYTYSDYSGVHKAVGGRLEIVRQVGGQKQVLHGGYFSATLDANRSKWLACEGEALAARLVIEHFSDYIRESKNVTTHFTDNLPTVFAWKKSQQGAYSTSPRISTFLTGISTLTIDIKHKPGTMMQSSDYSSRHPIKCDQDKCRICSFVEEWTVMGDNCDALRSITAQDVLDGNVSVPYMQRNSWIEVQSHDPVHTKLKYLISIGQLPEPKKTCGVHTNLKQLHNLYKKGELRVAKDGLIEVRQHGNDKTGWVISIPQSMFPGLLQALHLRLSHPSKSQMTQVVQRFYYTPGYLSFLDTLYENCHVCQSLKTLPKLFKPESSTKIEGFAVKFSADIIERCTQKIFVLVESLTGFTQAKLIPDQTTKTLEHTLFSMLSLFANPQGCSVRTDGAQGWQALKKITETSGTPWFIQQFSIDIGDPMNKNKNPLAENKIKEIQKEILKFKLTQGPITSMELDVVIRTINQRPRNKGNSSGELVFKRSQVDGSPISTDDSELATFIHELRTNTNSYKASTTNLRQEEQSFNVGDLVFIREDLTKLKPRDRYIVVSVDNGTIGIQKFDTSLRSKVYYLHNSQLILASYFRPGPVQHACNSESLDLSQDKPKKKSKLAKKTKPVAEITLPKQPIKTSAKASRSSDKSSPQGKGAPKSVNEYTSTSNRPRRAAATKAHHAWIKKVNKYMSKHGWDANQDFSDNLQTSHYITLDTHPHQALDTVSHSSDNEPDTDKFNTPSSSPPVPPQPPQRSHHSRVQLGPDAPVQALAQALAEVQPPPHPPKPSTRPKSKVDYRLLHTSGKRN